MNPIVIDRTYFFMNIKYKWRTAAGKDIYVEDLSITHLKNIYNLVYDNNRSFPNMYLGYSRAQWREVLRLEMIKRSRKDLKPKRY